MVELGRLRLTRAPARNQGIHDGKAETGAVCLVVHFRTERSARILVAVTVVRKLRVLRSHAACTHGND